jgi:hypothetical protein
MLARHFYDLHITGAKVLLIFYLTKKQKARDVACRVDRWFHEKGFVIH